jgi:uncharacterized membrane protein YbjE (DUF340 family)
MIITWAATGTPHYASMDGNIPYISDVGASYLKPLFITGASITAVGFVASLFVERILRSHGRLIENFRKRERVFSWLAILGSVIGGAGLILLTIFDTLRHSSLHRLFLLIFMVGVALSAVFSIIEFRWIAKDFKGARRLRRAYIMKGIIAGILIILAIAFGVSFAEILYGKEMFYLTSCRQPSTRRISQRQTSPVSSSGPSHSASRAYRCCLHLCI